MDPGGPPGPGGGRTGEYPRFDSPVDPPECIAIYRQWGAAAPLLPTTIGGGGGKFCSACYLCWTGRTGSGVPADLEVAMCKIRFDVLRLAGHRAPWDQVPHGCRNNR